MTAPRSSLARHLVDDARVTAAFRGEPFEPGGRAATAYLLARLMVQSDAYLAQASYRVAAAMRAAGVPLLPAVANRLAMVTAQVGIGPDASVGKGVYLAHGQLAVDGEVEIGEGAVFFPWVTVRPRHGETKGPTIGANVRVGTGAVIEGPITIGAGARIGANAVVEEDVAPGAVVAGVPARPIRQPQPEPTPQSQPKSKRQGPRSKDLRDLRDRKDANGAKGSKVPANPAASRTTIGNRQQAAKEAGRAMTGTATTSEIAATDTATSEERRALMQAGRAAEADGRYLDAIESFGAANRLKRTPKLDHKLVWLRNRAFDEVRSREAPVGEWPPVWPDPFPGTEGVPEIDGVDLTTAVLGGAIVNHGCLLVRNLLPPDTAKMLRRRAGRALDARDAAVEAGDIAEAKPWYHPFSPNGSDGSKGRDLRGERTWVQTVGGMLTADSPQIFQDLVEAYTACGVIPAIEEYLGERPALSFNKCVMRRMTSSAPTWHQDGKFIGSQVRAVDVWLALSECGGDTDTVGLDVVPKRVEELLDTDGHGSTFPNSIGNELVDKVAADVGIVTPRFSPGDALIFDDRFVHRSSVRDGLVNERYAIESWFFAPSRFPMQYVPVVV